MDREKKMTGRPQIYTGEPDSRIRRRETVAGEEKENGRTGGQEPEKAPAEAPQGAEKVSDPGSVPAAASAGTGAPEKRFGKPQPDQTANASAGTGTPEKRFWKPQPEQTAAEVSAGTDAGGKSGAGRHIRVPEAWTPVARRKREQENTLKMQILGVILGILTVLLIAAIIYEVVLGYGIRETGNERMAARREAGQSATDVSPEGQVQKADGGKAGEAAAQDAESGAQGAENEGSGDSGASEEEGTPGTAGGQAAAQGGDLLQQARLMAAQYDYSGAASLLKSAEGYEDNSEYQAAVSEFEQQAAACVAFPASEVTHIFFHTLIHDAGKAFDGDEYEDGYNQYMVTEGEFSSIIQQMYDRGYVMVFLDEIVPGTAGEDGSRTFEKRDIMLPPDKKPFVLSQDDVSYYHYMDGDGFASRLIVDENGDVKNEYIEDDGSISVGDYDMVPLIDRFVEQHPDFSYHGEKGYIALTGYEGILGYRTDEVYKTKEASRITPFQQMFFDSYPGGFDEAAFERECEGAKKVAEAMKANGWRFASHTWGHQNMSETNGVSYETFVRDTDRWEAWVEPLIGETDILIYAFGGDIRGAEPYSGDRFNYLKQAGFDYFCGVDSAQHWLQVGTDYVRQSRRNIDGYRMYYNPDMLSDLFDVSEAWDPLRPDSVPPI